MEHCIVILTVLRTTALLFAAVFLYFTGRAWLRTRASSMATLFVAVGLLAGGALAEGAALQGLGVGLDTAHLIESVFLLLGFLVLMLSVLLHRPGGRFRSREALETEPEPGGEEDEVPGP